MTNEQILNACRAAGEIGEVSHEEFANYVIGIENRKKVDEKWVSVEMPYLGVDGRLAMARADHRRQGKKLDILPVLVISDNEEATTVIVSVESEIYGKGSGTATSRKDQKNSSGYLTAESKFNFETAETSALGRALGSLGYGLFPGSGLSSAEDMQRVAQPERGSAHPERPAMPANSPKTATANGDNASSKTAPATQPALTAQPSNASETKTPTRTQPPMSPVQKNKMMELVKAVHPEWDETKADGLASKELERLFLEAYKHGMEKATYEESARMTGQLLTKLRELTGTTKVETGGK